MSLITFHRFLIATAIVFCFGFAGWELVLWWVTRAWPSLVLGGTFVALGALLAFYLAKLNRFLGYEGGHEGDEGPGEERERR